MRGFCRAILRRAGQTAAHPRKRSALKYCEKLPTGGKSRAVRVRQSDMSRPKAKLQSAVKPLRTEAVPCRVLCRPGTAAHTAWYACVRLRLTGNIQPIPRICPFFRHSGTGGFGTARASGRLHRQSLCHGRGAPLFHCMRKIKPETANPQAPPKPVRRRQAMFPTVPELPLPQRTEKRFLKTALSRSVPRW